jgi:hypothetical protein
MIYKKIQV